MTEITDTQREMIFSLLFLRHQIGNLKKESTDINKAREHTLNIVCKALYMEIQEKEKNTIKPTDKIQTLEDIMMAQIGGYQWLSELDTAVSAEKILLKNYLTKGIEVMEAFADKHENELN